MVHGHGVLPHCCRQVAPAINPSNSRSVACHKVELLKLCELFRALFGRRDTKRFLFIVVEIARVTGAFAFR
jgi:hypothetical protein